METFGNVLIGLLFLALAVGGCWAMAAAMASYAEAEAIAYRLRRRR